MLLCILNMYVHLLFWKSFDNEMSHKFTVKSLSLFFLTSYNMTFFLSLDMYGGIRSLVCW